MRLRHITRPYRSYQRLRRTGRFSAGPPTVLAGGFALLILAGGLLLYLPWANRQPITLFQALFTATSSVTVTGLSIVDVASQFTPFGQAIIALLVQLGGLGFVTFALVAAAKLGKKISLRHQNVAMEAFNQTSVARLNDTALFVCKLALCIELVAFAVLAAYWSLDGNVLEALGHAAFHTIMAFNNAGMSLVGTHLDQHLDATLVILTTTLLIILGGLGFSVLDDCWRKRRWSRLTAYSQVILLATLILNLLAFAVIWLLEHRNPLTMADLSVHDQAMAAWLQAVAARTAGFQGVETADLTQGSAMVLMGLMFIGGGSLSTASGIKVGTFVILLAAAYSYLRGRSDIVLLKRSVPVELVYKALALLLLTTGLAFSATLALTLLEPQAQFLDLAFEVISALSTTGSTRGPTSEFSVFSQALVMALMFIGRIGPLTLVYSLSMHTRSRVRYPEAQFQVG